MRKALFLASTLPVVCKRCERFCYISFKMSDVSGKYLRSHIYITGEDLELIRSAGEEGISLNGNRCCKTERRG